MRDKAANVQRKQFLNTFYKNDKKSLFPWKQKYTEMMGGTRLLHNTVQYEENLCEYLQQVSLKFKI